MARFLGLANEEIEGKALEYGRPPNSQLRPTQVVLEPTFSKVLLDS